MRGTVAPADFAQFATLFACDERHMTLRAAQFDCAAGRSAAKLLSVTSSGTFVALRL